MEVRVAHVVLDAVHGESTVAGQARVRLVSLTDAIAPMLNHLLFLVLDHHVKKEAAPEVEDHQGPHEAHAVLLVEPICFPVEVAHWVLEEASDVFEGSPSLCVVSWLLGVVHEFAEVTVGVLGQSSDKMGKQEWVSYVMFFSRK